MRDNILFYVCRNITFNLLEHSKQTWHFSTTVNGILQYIFRIKSILVYFSLSLWYLAVDLIPGINCASKDVANCPHLSVFQLVA